MPVTQRDTRRHTYGDYLEWSRDYGDEVIDGVAYVREPPSPSWIHQELVVALTLELGRMLEGTSYRVCLAPLDVRLPRTKLPLYERTGVPEVWLVHPTDRTLAIYRLEDGRYGRPIYQELKGQALLSAVPDVSVDWDRVMTRLV